MAVQEHADHPFNKATLDEFVERFWKCESLGTPNEANSKDDITCLDFFNETTRYDEGECRYYTRLPFRSEPPEVPENFQHSLSCLRSNWRTLSKHPEHLQKYDDIIQDQVKRGIISEVPPSQLYTTGTFLSHHAVINETKKTTKIRLVYNGSAKVNGSPSLNDCLFRGPVSNPADIGSRGTSIDELLKNDQWWNGPSFLKMDEQQWPKDKSEDNSVDETINYAVNTNMETKSFNGTEEVIKANNFSSWKKLLRVVITILIFIFNIKLRIATKKRIPLKKPVFNKMATLTLFRQAQSLNPIFEDQKRNLHAFLESETQLWRSKGRTSNSALSFDAKNPIILPRHSWVTSLYILHIHEENHHIGVAQTLTTLRQYVWIPQGRTEVKRTIKKHCLYCRKEKATPFRLPPFPDHPSERVNQPKHPFYVDIVASTTPDPS
ncbi:hypothetical protein ANCCAN_22842 [Ancylostoma caninum]|uniref:Integrase zinc-binding domain-containing protein n=1 Tax=Ancylostoma caninum TaxID=29170 RepID=A0A368FH32_ANCCA|nr:hypothetical protein ANCCAN_22842 [Ancylostoma caninum]